VKHDENFSADTLDVHGNPAPLWAIGTRWKHSGNGKVYRVHGVTWLGATDEWGIAMRATDEDDAVSVTRPEHHLLGKRDNGDFRYERVFA